MNGATEDRCREMHRNGHTWAAIGRAVGLGADTVRRALDPEWAARRRDMINAARRCREGRPTRERVSKPLQVAGRTEAKRDAERLYREVPEDTRSLTEALLGDPLPGRSALDQHRAIREAAE